MPEKRKRGRPKGSGGKKKDWPVLKNVTPKDLKAAQKLVADSFIDAMGDAGVKPQLLNAPVFDQGKLQKRINELTNHEALPFEEMPFPEGWDKMGKIEKLRFLTANKNK